jgi:hypothetical protein
MSRESRTFTLETSGMPKKKSRLTLPKRKPKTKKTVIWEVRAILEERTNDKGDVEYRVDWEPDENGKEYAPLWVRRTRSQALLF